ncbi:MAG: S-methyl-5-thioribose-1-phosphate isomerase [Magnetovibrio sp.]|nr:S-methyl-5-thioribose-1-phosphate isomerase [Magnetovibrio sp.]|tara:strand:+ start:1873 stop:2979 length:1107 start_codon:yes stop_codon:yes gene_type:complete
MLVDGKPTRTIWLDSNCSTVNIIDQTRLPHEFITVGLDTLGDTVKAISNMQVRGAPLIGATAAYGMALAMGENASNAALDDAYAALYNARPTAVNLRWALDDLKAILGPLPESGRKKAAYARAAEIADEDVEQCSALGEHGKVIIENLWIEKKRPKYINVLTHCNAGWLATVDWGTALSPIYKAHDAGIPVHVWVDETRPRNQGANLTCWELDQHGVPHTLIVDNVGGHLMQHGKVDLCIVGTDRTTAAGDVCNKTGTYLKALAAADNNVPFYVGLPGPTIDWTITDGVRDIIIEERDPDEVKKLTGLTDSGSISAIAISPQNTQAINYAFDVTPACLITGLITERGVTEASKKGLATLYPEQGLNRI